MIDTLEDIKEIILKKKEILIGVLIVLVLGLLFGSIYITILNNNDKKEIMENVTLYFNSFKNISFQDKLNIFKESFLKNVIYFLIMWVLGISMIGFPIILIMIFYRSFLFGFSIASIFIRYKLSSIYKIIIYIFPGRILLFILSIFLAVFSINISNKLIKSCFKKKSFNFNTFGGKYFLLLLICIILCSVTSLIDAFIMPLFYRIKI